jgi:hypothetical protein
MGQYRDHRARFSSLDKQDDSDALGAGLLYKLYKPEGRICIVRENGDVSD